MKKLDIFCLNINMFINNLNDNKWDERLTDTEKPIFMK